MTVHPHAEASPPASSAALSEPFGHEPAKEFLIGRFDKLS